MFIRKLRVSSNWIWSISASPAKNTNIVLRGCNDGTIKCEKLIPQTVHGIYANRYGFREDMTNVVVEDLISKKRAKLKTGSYVKKISLYR